MSPLHKTSSSPVLQLAHRDNVNVSDLPTTYDVRREHTRVATSNHSNLAQDTTSLAQTAGQSEDMNLANASFPSRRRWGGGEYFHRKARVCVYGVTMVASLLGFCVTEPHTVRGDMINSMAALPGVLARGAAGTVSQGGNAAFLRIEKSDNTVSFSSAFAFNYGGKGHAYFAGHSAFNNLALNPTFSIGTGSNFNANPGDLYSVVNFRIAPGFNGQSSIGTAMDLTYAMLDREVVGAGEISFPTLNLDRSGRVDMVSFGNFAILDQGFFGQTGDAYGGWANIVGTSTIFGGNPELYQRANVSSFELGSTRATNGSSGGLVTRQVDGVTYAAGIVTHGQTSSSALGYQYLRFDTQSFQSFHAENMAAVPEPSTLLLATTGLGGLLLGRRFRSKRSNAATSKG